MQHIMVTVLSESNSIVTVNNMQEECVPL